jgi:hypothetical protein
MMTSEPSAQMLLFDPTPKRQTALSCRDMMSMEPASRDRDPVSSNRAAEAIKQSGVGGKQRLAVYMALRQHQGCTSAELAEHMGADRYCPSRRLPELARAGWVCRGRRRRCKVSGVVCKTWWIVRGWAEGSKTTAPVPSRPAGQNAPAPAAGEREPVAVLTPEERRRLRERMMQSGDSLTRKFLAGVAQGGGGAK